MDYYTDIEKGVNHSKNTKYTNTINYNVDHIIRDNIVFQIYMTVVEIFVFCIIAKEFRLQILLYMVEYILFSNGIKDGFRVG